jgi:hypothetical protein
LKPPVSEKIAAGGGEALIVEIAYEPLGVFCVDPPGPVGESLPHATRTAAAAAAHSVSSALPRRDDAFLA